MGCAANAATPMIRSLVSIPDVHGDLARLQSAFQLANLTDSRHAWRAPAGTVVVQTGDLVDRGDEIQGIVAFLQAMEDQAAAAGSVLHRLLGNHEIMSLMGDLRYVTRGDLASFGGHTARAAAFAQDGKIGAWLLRARICVEVAGTVFVHAGIHPRYASLGCDGINARAAEELSRAVPRGGERRSFRSRSAMLEDQEGPVWYRGIAESDDCSELQRSLSALRARRMVVGHTIQEHGKMRLRCGGALALTDVGMTRGYDGMLGHANRVAVLHVLDQGPNGTTVPPHAEYLDGRMGRAVEELGAPQAVAPSIMGMRRNRRTTRTARRLRLAPGPGTGGESMLEAHLPPGAIALGAAGDLMMGSPL